MFRPAASARSIHVRRRARGFVAVTCAVSCAAALAAGCRDLTSPAQDPTRITYAPALGIDLSRYTRDTSGVYYLDVTVGSGPKAIANSTVLVYYTGWLADGRRFGAVQPPESPFSFVIGQGQTVRGFDRGLLNVPQGTRRRLVIPPALGYGNVSQANNIPAGSVLVYEVDVNSVTQPATTTK